jgi:glycosyltransferase involved in cell wall biosynthesis
MRLTPILSVIMTIYNGEKFLRETLDAIFSQTFTDFELVVVNNGCTDSTQDILDSYDDPRMRVVFQTLEKPTFGDGIRLAYANAKGEFIAVNDGDDVPVADRFEKQVAALKADEKLGLVSGWFEEIDENSQPIQECKPPTDIKLLFEAYQSANPLAHSTYMYRKTAADQVGGYVSKYHYGSDFALALEMIKAGWTLKVLPFKVLRLRVHSGQASQAADLSVMRAYEAKELFAVAATLPDLSDAAVRQARKNNVKRIIQYGLALKAENRHAEGWKQILSGVAKSPSYGIAYYLFRVACSLGLIKHPVYSPHRS